MGWRLQPESLASWGLWRGGTVGMVKTMKENRAMDQSGKIRTATAAKGKQTANQASRLQGTLCVVVSAVGFGALGILGKTAYQSGASTVTVLFLRFLLAGTLMTALMTAFKLPWPRGRDLAILLALGALGYVGQSFCYFSALHHATAGLTALLLYLYPALTTLASAALGRQRLTWGKAALAGLSLLGVLLTVAGDLGGSAVGLVFGVGSAVIYTGYILVGEGVIPRVGAVAASTVVMLAAAAVYACAALADGPHWPTQISGWLAVVGIALVATVVPIIGFFAGMRRLGAADAATLSTLEPVVTLLLAFVFLNETLAPVQLLGAGAVVVAVALLSRMR